MTPFRNARVCAAIGVCLLGFGTTGARLAHAQDLPAVSSLSLDSLLNIHVSAATRYQQDARSAPASIVVVTNEEIRRFSYRTLADVLADVPGFYISNDRNYSYLGVRGFSRPTDYNNRILVLLNGQRLNEGYYGAVPIGNDLGVDLRGLERIEIVRGPGSALYGTSAMFAVINLVSAEVGAIAKRRLTGDVSPSGTRSMSGEYAFQFGGLDVVAGANINRRDGSDVYFSEFDSAATNNGIAQDLDWERAQGGFVSAHLGVLTVQAFGTLRDRGVPTASYGSVFNDDRAQTRDGLASIEARVDAPLGVGKQVQLRVRRDGMFYHGVYPASDGEYSDENRVRSTGLEGSLTWDLAPWHRLVIGSEANWYTAAHYSAALDGVAYNISNVPFSNYSVYGQSEIRFHRVILYSGLRQDWGAAGNDAMSPRLGLVLSPDSRTNIKVLWGTAFRAPNAYETSFKSRSHEVSAVKPEKVRTAEVVANRRLSRQLIVRAAAFHSDIVDLLDLVDDSVTGLTHFSNVEKAHSVGGDVELLWRHAGSEAHIGYAYSDAESNGQRLTNSPAHLVRLRTGTRLSSHTDLAFSTRYETKRRTVYDTWTKPSFVADVFLNIRAWRAVATLEARNVFDTEYATPGGFEHRQSAIIQDGRSIGLRLEWLFN